MRHVAALGLALAAMLWLAPAGAQGPADPPDAAELTRLYERWQAVQDPQEKIDLGERLLQLDPASNEWPLAAPRERVKGEIHVSLGRAYLARGQGSLADNIEKAIGHYEQALAVYTREAFPQEWAQAHAYLGAAYASRQHGQRAENVEKGIAHLEAALGVRTREAVPQDWAETQNLLGAAYSVRLLGDRAENQEKAIAAQQDALTVFTRDAFPREWARTQTALGVAYSNRIRGEKAENLESAIAHYQAALAVYTPEAFPRERAAVQGSLGSAYLDRIRGDRADNVERAITIYEAALAALTREGSPREWAQAKSKLGVAYGQRLRGERADNQEKAIAAYEEALTVMTREAFPHEWAAAQFNLGLAYSSRIRGDQAESLKRAIAHYEAALTVRTRESQPQAWAYTKSLMGSAYLELVPLEGLDSVEKAIPLLEEALTVLSRDIHPDEWATAQNLLGVALWLRKGGDPEENVEKAIKAAEATLTVWTRETVPLGWSAQQVTLGMAYANRTRGDPADNLRKAVAHLEAVLTFHTRETRPRDHLRTATMLGGVYAKAGDWHKAGLAYAAARETFLMLVGEGAGEAEVRALVTTAGPLFTDAAFAAAQRGEGEAALALVSEGRARLLAAALRLQMLDLPADRRRRLEELRAQIRAGEAAVEAARGGGRAAVVDMLAALRAEVLGIVKSAAAPATGAGSPLAQARALVAAGGALAVPIVAKTRGKLLIVTKAGPVGIVDLPELTADRLSRLVRGGEADEVGGWLGAYNINYLEGDEADRRWPEWTAAIADLGPELWHLLGSRLDAALKARGVRPGARLIWLPTGALGILPLGLAQDPASKRHLAESYEIVYAPSLEALAAAQAQVAQAAKVARTARASLAAIVNPTGDLPHTETEGAMVASHFAARSRALLKGTAATPEPVLAALKGKTHWHFASHGRFSWEDARASALVLHAFAPLSVGRLMDTDGLGRPRLVVLSACETGLYDIDRNPEEFVGLPGAFTALGAAGVVGSLWPVADDATSLLMAKFYELHMGHRLAPPTALRRAQLWLRQATDADLQAYAQLAARQRRLEHRQADAIAAALTAEGRMRSRRRAPPGASGPDASGAPGAKEATGATQPERPYAHPYYWAGFVHTGL